MNLGQEKNIEIRIPGLTIAAKVWGNPQLPPILAVHGWLDNANSFDQIAYYLQHHYHLIAIDLPGHGYSAHLSSGMHYHFIDGVYTLIEILDALQLPQVHLLGHSLGACLTSIVAGVAPHRILSLSLIEGLGPITHLEETARKQLAHYWDSLLLMRSKKPKGYQEMDKAALARSLRGYISFELAKILCERGLIEKEGLFYWRHDQRLLIPSPLRMTENQVHSCLEQINAKTLLLWAKQGFSFNYQLMQARVALLKNLEIVELDGGHHIHMEQPEATAKLLASFYN